ncbi:hypothetical protein Q4534_10105 [Cyclobacterium sp. 1_MG-2023]|uniref:hypothetical protein n=1 Tax=Cyclobacterium sp. 1_MG-2023 TaxID=3062681 RepID=UPI0026E1B275|nr:hypothetical protein [Cyclobacterium sp. 1_MG-2023]MDO6437762.1 hypothetical protein [Cyclobacterium sp. 1_MG-2023]
MKVFFNSTQLLKTVSLFILTVVFGLVTGNTYSQDFVSVKDGEWKADNTWESSSNCSKWSNVSDGQPPVSKSWGCKVTVVINHEVTYSGNISGFGSGVFTSLEIGPNGKLIFEDNVTINGGGSEPEIILAEGAELVVNGTFDIDRGVEIIVPNNAKLTINNFEIGDNKPVITIEEGAMLVVNEETHVRSKSTLNVFGQFQTDELNYSSGGEINIGSKDFSGEVSVSGNMLIGNGELNMFNSSTLMVGGTSSTGSSGSINLEDNANIRLVGDVEMGQGGSMTLKDNAEFSFESKYFTSGGADIELNDNARGTVHEEVIMTNGRIYLNNSSELMLGSTFTATNGATVVAKDDGAMFICDYPNSTKENTSHVNLSGNSFYGMGCFALPVVWKSFDVVVTNNNISKLVWETTSEDGNSHFEVERSINGIGNFEKIAAINGSGWTNSISKYTFEDPELSEISGLVYYRIRQIDFDGNQMISDVVSIKASGEEAGEEPILLTAYPNPTDGSSLNIKLASGKISGPVNVRFLQTSSVASFEGEVGMELDQWLLTVVNNASKGMGVLEVIYEGEAYRMKIMKI